LTPSLYPTIPCENHTFTCNTRTYIFTFTRRDPFTQHTHTHTHCTLDTTHTHTHTQYTMHTQSTPHSFVHSYHIIHFISYHSYHFISFISFHIIHIISFHIIPTSSSKVLMLSMLFTSVYVNSLIWVFILSNLLTSSSCLPKTTPTLAARFSSSSCACWASSCMRVIVCFSSLFSFKMKSNRIARCVADCNFTVKCPIFFRAKSESN